MSGVVVRLLVAMVTDGSGSVGWCWLGRRCVLIRLVFIRPLEKLRLRRTCTILCRWHLVHLVQLCTEIRI